MWAASLLGGKNTLKWKLRTPSGMANDREMLREIWDGKIPVCFTLDSEETCELQGPDPFYLMVPRLSYFPLCTEKVRSVHAIILLKSDVIRIEFPSPFQWIVVYDDSCATVILTLLFIRFRWGNTSYDTYKAAANKNTRCGWNSTESRWSGTILSAFYWTFISMISNCHGTLLFILINFQKTS